MRLITRKSVFILFAVAILPSAFAGTWNIQDESATYRDSFTPTISCSGDCPNSVSFELTVCQATDTSAVPGGGTEITGPSSMNFGSLAVPSDFPCSSGANEMTLEVDEGSDGSVDSTVTSTLIVNPKGSMNPNIAKFIYAEVNYDTDTMRYMFLSNDESDRSRPPSENPYYPDDGAYVFIAQHDGFLDPDEEIYFRSRDVDKAVKNGKKERLMLDQTEKLAELLNQTQYNEICPEGSGDKPNYCDVAEKSFINSYSFNPGHIPSLDTQSGLHEDGKYQPDAHIIKGYKPEAPGEGPYFFVCRSGSDGKLVSLSSDGKAPYYRCDLTGDNSDLWRVANDGITVDTEDWDRVYTCSDGRDNDDDHSADMNDNACQERGWDGKSETWNDPPVCNPVITFMKDGSIYGNYSGTYTNTGCQYSGSTEQTYSEWASVTPLEQFTCIKGDTTSDYSGFYAPSKQDFCSAVDYTGHVNFNTNINLVAPDGVKMPAVMYQTTYQKLYQKLEANFPSRNECPLQNYVSCIAGTTAKTDWVSDEYDVWVPKFQSLHQAEQKYSNGTLHEAWYWGDTKGMVGTSNGYDPGNPSDTMESWTIGNVTGQANNKIGSNQFPGGFAGKCPSGESWQQRSTPEGSTWICSGRVSNWLQTVVVPDISGGSGKETIGVVIMPYNFETSTSTDLDSALTNVQSSTGVDISNVRTYREAQFNDLPKIDTLPDSKQIKNVTARCKPSGASNWKFENAVEIDYSKTPTPVAVWGKAEVSGGEFVCEWWYFRKDEDGTGYDKITDAGVQPIDLAEGGGRTEKRDALTTVFKDKLGYDWIQSQYTSAEFENLVTGWEGSFFTKQW